MSCLTAPGPEPPGYWSACSLLRPKAATASTFLLIEDNSGLLQATIFSGTYRRYGYHLYRAAAFLLEGRVEQDARRGFSFVVERIWDLGAILAGREAVPDVPVPEARPAIEQAPSSAAEPFGQSGGPGRKVV